MSLSLSKKEEGSSCTTIGCINNVSVERRGEGGERGEGEEGEREEREEREGRKINYTAVCPSPTLAHLTGTKENAQLHWYAIPNTPTVKL